MLFDGDLKLFLDGKIDILFPDGVGQPVMTDGIDSLVVLSVFGEDNWQNSTVTSSGERFQSQFPAVLSRARVNEQTKKDGKAAIDKALGFLVSEGIANQVEVTGEILSAYGIGWNIDITKSGKVVRYRILWERQALQFTGGAV